MNIAEVFKGKIFISAAKKPKSKLPFSFTTSDFSIDQVVMSNFDNLKFSIQEKRGLTCQSRKIIKQYQSLSTTELKKFSKDLIKMIKSIDSDVITIDACDAGSFICLISIFSGKLPRNKEIFFNLKEAPVKLFSKSFIEDKNAAGSVSVNLNYSPTCWLRNFKTLQTPSSFDIHSAYMTQDQLMAS